MTENRLWHGAAWYPELWDAPTRAADIGLMKKTGISVVRIGEFIWSRIERDEGSIDLSFFARVLDDLEAAGIKAVLCTPTATPPVWMSHGHPERMYVNAQGVTMTHGSRQHACTNNAHFRERARIIVEAEARAFGSHPALVGWQLDNEFKCHVAECMCETCLGLWHEWLEARYGTIAMLNDAWGTDVWSETYRSFSEIPQPVAAVPFLQNSSLSTLYRLFSQEKIAEFAHEQTSVIRRHSSVPVTHNGNVFFHVDNEQFFADLDFASFDSYADSDNYRAYLFNCDLWRCLKPGVPFWVMETGSSFAASLVSHGTPHPRGYLAAEAFASYAAGAQGFCYWLWRQQRAGCEQPHSAVITAWGKDGQGYGDVLLAERVRGAIEPVMTATRPRQAEVAFIWSDRAKEFWETETLGEMEYRQMTASFYGRILLAGFHRDVITESHSLEGYKLLFSPYLPALTNDSIDRAAAMVASGGVWVIGPLTGWRTAEHTVHTDSALGYLDRVTGLEPCQMWPAKDTDSTGVAFGASASLTRWSFAFDPSALSGVRSVGTISSGLMQGLSFIVERSHGKGKFVYLGSIPHGGEGDVLLDALIAHYAKEAGVGSCAEVTGGTLAVPRDYVDAARSGTGASVLAVVNLDGKGGSVVLPAGARDLVTGKDLPAGKNGIGTYGYLLAGIPEGKKL